MTFINFLDTPVASMLGAFLGGYIALRWLKW
jgi:hypothetical protein